MWERQNRSERMARAEKHESPDECGERSCRSLGPAERARIGLSTWLTQGITQTPGLSNSFLSEMEEVNHDRNAEPSQEG
jgi:hypothetical protein